MLCARNWASKRAEKSRSSGVVEISALVNLETVNKQQQLSFICIAMQSGPTTNYVVFDLLF